MTSNAPAPVFDVRALHFDIPDIRAHLHPLDGRRPESLTDQRRVLRRWTHDADALHAATRRPREETRARQLERLRLIVEHAYATHPIYHRHLHEAGYRSGDLITWADYAALPTISKAQLIDGLAEIQSHLRLGDREHYTSRTSGSSGQVLTIIQADATNDQGTLLYLRQFEQMLGRRRRPDEWLYEIYLAPQRVTSLDGRYPVFTLSQECPPAATAEHLRRLRPTVVWAFPSYLQRLVATGTDLTSMGIEVVCTHSEASTAGERASLAESFGAPVLDEYSSEELYLIASQCRHGRYHLVEDNVRVDVLDPDGDGVGQIVATSLVNTTMPFIRYLQGDLISIDDEAAPCACGSTHRSLKVLHGRADQVLTARSGDVAPDRIMGLYDETLLAPGSGIAEFHLRQTSVDRVELVHRRVPDADADVDACIDRFCVGLRTLFGDARLVIERLEVDEMPRGLSHKRRLITNSIGCPTGAAR